MLYKTLLDEAFNVLSFHNKSGHTPIQTLNRLMQGHPKRADKTKTDFLIERLIAKEDKWPVEKLKLLTCHGRSCPVNRNVPIIIFKEEDEFFLADGNNRINLLHQEKSAELQRVIILELV